MSYSECTFKGCKYWHDLHILYPVTKHHQLKESIEHALGKDRYLNKGIANNTIQSDNDVQSWLKYNIKTVHKLVLVMIHTEDIEKYRNAEKIKLTKNTIMLLKRVLVSIDLYMISILYVAWPPVSSLLYSH